MTIYATCPLCLQPYPFPLNVHHRSDYCLEFLRSLASENRSLHQTIAAQSREIHRVDEVRDCLDDLIMYWARVWSDPRQQMQADAFIEAFEVAQELLDGGSVVPVPETSVIEVIIW